MSAPVGLVVVSHSRPLAAAAVALAREMAPPDLPIEIAAGLAAGPDGSDGSDGSDGDGSAFGTDAVAIAAAIEAADGGSGVVVLMDLGSAVLSAELALDLLSDPDQRDRVLLCPAPLVEGLVVAAVSAGGGAARAAVAAEARDALAGKLSQLGEQPPTVPEQAPEVPERTPTVPEQPPEAPEREDRVVGTFRVANPHGLHARPAARLVGLVRRLDGAELRLRNRSTGSEWVPAGSLARVAVVGAEAGHEVEIEATGPRARSAVDAVLELAARDFDEPAGAPAPPATTPEQPSATGTASVDPVATPPAAPPPPGASAAHPAVAGSPGIAIGPAQALVPVAVVVPDDPPQDPATEGAALDRALAAARTEIEAARDATARSVGPAEAEIFDAHLMMLDDPELAGAARTAIDAGTSAARAWADAVERGAGAMDRVADPYLAARAADVRAVGEQVLRALVTAPPDGVAAPPAGQESHFPDAGGPESGFPATAVGDGRPGRSGAGGVRVVLVAADLTPAQAVGLEADRVGGVVLAAGSPTAHATLLLRAKGVPAVLGAGSEVLAVPDGTVLAMDGATGELVVDPPAEVLASFRDRAAAGVERDRAARALVGDPAVTRDGVHVLVGANIGAAADATAAVGADLAGLVRTEFLFLDRTAAPDVTEQVAAYRGIAEALDGRRITLRTLDVGGDKPLPYLPLPVEANPFLGLRGIRLADVHAELFRDQLRAAVRVAHETPVSLMFPMVSVLDELLAARRELDAVITAEGRGAPAGLQVGIMVEVPAAALKAAAFVPHVDFLSIGTNDLTQYALAAERGNPAVAHLADPLDPGVLRLVAAVCRAADGRALVAVCGEAAADPVAAGLLVGLGVRELSVVPPAVAGTKQAVRGLDTAAAARAAATALTADTAAAVRALP